MQIPHIANALWSILRFSFLCHQIAHATFDRANIGSIVTVPAHCMPYVLYAVYAAFTTRRLPC